MFIISIPSPSPSQKNPSSQTHLLAISKPNWYLPELGCGWSCGGDCVGLALCGFDMVVRVGVMVVLVCGGDCGFDGCCEFEFDMGSNGVFPSSTLGLGFLFCLLVSSPCTSSLPSTMAEQTEKAYLKQPKVFPCSKKSGKGKRPGKGGNRFWKSIGLKIKTPRDAIEGTYIDKKCPFTGDVSIRGRIITGTCHSAKMIRTIIVRRDYLHFVKKYQRYEKRHSNIPAHVSPCFRVKEGDYVVIGQCRPLSKTVRFNVLRVVPSGSSGGVKKAFTGI
ncbi:40S ribosomal protein S11 [Fagus crenata]